MNTRPARLLRATCTTDVVLLLPGTVSIDSGVPSAARPGETLALLVRSLA